MSRSGYESSHRWRVTRPLRALGRRALRLRAAEIPPAGLAQERCDSWLEHLHGDRLDLIEAACEAGGAERFALFRDLDADLWALLLTQEFSVYPHIRSLLPTVPDPDLQVLWNGASGVQLAAQGAAFYRKVLERFAQAHAGPLSGARVLDFGCGWGRLTRCFARDVEPGRLFGCDPVQGILDVGAESGVPARLARSEFMPDRLPFDERFDLAFSFSVFTHLSEAAHMCCLRALHAALAPGGLLVVTVRPPEYLRFCERMHPLLDALGPDARAWLKEPRYLFVPHDADPRHPQYDGAEI
ncbi:MAG TPA: class I SAM-dependent methyltransferase, partial [Solirubrobacteraceae bacterium]|nr:class I SAM-dependent methyltransferase [Solirubrobacteraceae bacterium]